METKRFYLLKPISTWLSSRLWLWLLFLAPTAFSQSPVFQCGAFSNGSDPNLRYDYYDRFGNGYMADDLALWILNLQQNHCDPIEDFELIFENTNGMFPFTTDELETICDVFTYLSDVIDAPSGEKAIVRLSKNPDLDAGTGAIGTSFFNQQCGLGYSVVEQQLLTGGINTPQHALIQVNADISNFYIGPAGGIGANELDFYTVILHEALHTLGFGSQITPSGASNQGFYTLWDLNLRNPAGDFMVVATPGGSGPCCADYIFNSDDFPNMPDLIWDQDCGANNVQFDVALLPPVNGEYDPANQDVSTFMNVLSHLDRDCPGGEHYVMHSGIPNGSDGVQRILTATELSILCKLGYDTDDCNPDCIAIAADDGNYFVGLNQSIQIDFNTLLSNDIPTDATFTYKPLCGNHDGLSITLGGTFVNVFGAAIGAYTFCYTITSCNGKRCDVGTVRVVVTNPAIVEACQNLEPCQINPFWDFELFGSPDEMYPLLTLGEGNGMGDGVANSGFTFYQTLPPFPFYDNTPDLFVNPFQILWTCGGSFITNLSTPYGNQCLGMIVRRINGENLSEGASFPLCEPIFPGMSGTVTFYGMTPQACSGTSQVRVEFSEGAPVDGQVVYVNPGISSPSWFVPITTTQNTNPVFGLYTVTFTNETEVCWNYLYLSSFTNTDNFPPPLPGFGYVLVDNVRVELQNNLTDVLDVATSATPADPCLGDMVTLEIEICNNVACLPNTFSNPEFLVTGLLPPGLTHVPNDDFPTLSHLVQSDGIPFGECLTLELTAQVGSDPGLAGQAQNINLSFDAHNDCYEDFAIVAGTVTPILCVPQGFTCPCNSNGLNIDASENSPHYDPNLGGTRYSDLEIDFNYDQNNDGVIGQNEHNDCIAILGRLIMDQNLTITNCDNIQMQPCSEIMVGTDAIHSSLNLTHNEIYACETMWHGITVTPNAKLNFRANEIRDAQFAITAIGSSGIGVDPPTRMIANFNQFSNNHIGVYFPGSAATNVDHIPFVGNTFTSTADLLPSCDAGLFNYSSTLRGYAGVITQGTPLGVGANVVGNNFSFIRNGVLGNNAVVNVNRSDFQNIIGFTPGISGIANARGNGVAAFGGSATVLNSNFNIVTRGVLGMTNQNLTVRLNTMPVVWRGVETSQVHSSAISDNLSIGFANTGILCREVVPANGLNAHSIENNTNMFVSQFPGIGLNYYAAIDIDNVMSSDAGSASITNNHFFSGGNFSDGIRLNGSGGWDIDGNTIDFQAPASPFFSNSGEGIRLSSTHENYLYQNHINDFDLSLRQSIGMSLAVGTGNRYCCNSTFGNKTGSYFFGACGSTEWRVTDMSKHALALSCAEGTVISPQFDYGNNFNATSGTAFHGGVDQDVLNSSFEVLNMQQPHWPEAIATPNATAQFFDDGGVDAYCFVGPCTAPQYAPPPPDRDIDESDLTTAAGGYSSGQYGATLQWESGRRLYERMSDYEGMIGTNTATDAFYTTAMNGKIGAYYQAEYAAKSIHNYPPSIANGLQTSAAQLESNRLAVEATLAGLAQAQTTADSALIYQSANAQHQSGQAAAEALISYQMQAQAFGNAAAFDAYIATNSLFADNLLEQNRKTVQRLYLQTLGVGIPQLSLQQLAEVEAIALQCPLEGGSAVYAARALYRLNIDRVFVDDSLCVETQERGARDKQQLPLEGISLIPSPANGLVSVKGLSSSEEQPVEVSLLDLNGKVCVNQVGDTGEVTLSTIDLLQGVYICQIKVRGKPPVALKLIIVH